MNQEASSNLHIRYTRAEWNDRHETSPPFQLSLSVREKLLQNHELAETEICQVYSPIVHRFVQLYHHLQQAPRTAGIPLIIGIAGSVAGGKSTTAKILHALFEDQLGEGSVAVVSTDSFLYPTQTMIDKNLLHQKGFPESYDMESLIQLLYDLKSGCQEFVVPIYSHATYDILPNQVHGFSKPKMVIIEGLNVLQVNPVCLQKEKRTKWIACDFIDISIYVDAKEEDQISWYLDRVYRLWEDGKNNPTSYYHQFAHLSKEEVIEQARSVWQKINHVNLYNYILPSRERADVILYKNHTHQITDIYVQRKLRI